PPSLPLPGSHHDPRQAAISAAAHELERCGVAPERQTLLVAGGLARRTGRRDLENAGIVSPEFARRFHGRVEIHDAEDPLLVAIERELARRTALVGASVVLNHPRLTGAFRGYPYDPEALPRIARSPLRRGFALLPAPLRDRIMKSFRRELTVAAAFAGPPSVAH